MLDIARTKLAGPNSSAKRPSRPQLKQELELLRLESRNPLKDNKRAFSPTLHQAISELRCLETLAGYLTEGVNRENHLDEAIVDNLPSLFIEGRMSSTEKRTKQRMAVLQGTLDMLILRTLLYGPAHGHQIGKHIQRTTNEFLQMQHGSLYPALHRLEQRGWVAAKWEMAPDRNREFKYYRLTEKGRKQLVIEESQWKQMMEAVARVMWPSAEES
jgi:transcriptional regulator